MWGSNAVSTALWCPPGVNNNNTKDQCWYLQLCLDVNRFGRDLVIGLRCRGLDVADVADASLLNRMGRTRYYSLGNEKEKFRVLQQPIADRNSTKPDHGKGVQSAVKENAGPLNVYRIWILICIWK